ncbi:MAG TPA: ABC transporter substrate-binding protein, partial [Usitatibacter sp.]|nr:ABC transporter substrate-binding protein [Usitatibacter sp.]
MRGIAKLAAALALALVLPAHAEKVLRYAFPIAETGFDPVQISELYSSNLIDNIYDTPLKYDYLARPVKLVPNTLTAMPEITEGGTLYTMHVKPGIYFDNDAAFHGRKRELTAADYVYSIKRSYDPLLKSPNLYFFEGFVAGMDEVMKQGRKSGRMDYDAPVDGLRVLDRYTFQIKLTKANYNFLYYLAYCNLTCAVAREVDEFYGPERSMEHPVG